MRMHEYFKPEQPLFSTRLVSGSKADYDFNKPPKRTSKFIDNLKSSVPLLSDHYKNSNTHAAASLSVNKTYSRLSEGVTKTKSDYSLSNIFYQSTFQKMLQTSSNLNTDKAPFSHFSLNKDGKVYPNQLKVDNFRAYPAVKEGRNRVFYSSQIF